MENKSTVSEEEHSSSTDIAWERLDRKKRTDRLQIEAAKVINQNSEIGSSLLCFENVFETFSTK